MQKIDFSNSLNYWLTVLFIFLGVFGRYALVASIFQLIFKQIFKTEFENRTVQSKKRIKNQELKEVLWSMLTSIIFGFGGTWLFMAWQDGKTEIYFNFNEFSSIYYIFSIVLVLFLHETYYYWLHRLMHHPKIYKWVHRVHHDSITTSAWTSFSFHPLESILQALAIPIITFLLPIHYSAIGIILVVMTTTSVINHLNTEIYPRDFNKHWFGRWWIGATHHSLHHAQFRYNFGLYFTFWDKIMQTESPDYNKLFEEKTKK
jgi:sterol desaturase/sphingolipid hydroxylase (fatty acid hydroxylase superfamily)